MNKADYIKDLRTLGITEFLDDCIGRRMCELYSSGYSFVEIARIYNLPVDRIKSIVRKYKEN